MGAGRFYNGSMTDDSVRPTPTSKPRIEGDPTPAEESTFAVLALAWGPVLAVVAAMVMVPIRSLVGTPGAVLVLTAVVIGASTQSRSAGAFTALTAAIAFNFFHAPPYYTLRIDGLYDIVATALLFLLGLGVAQLAARGRASRRTATDQLQSVEVLESVVAAAARGDIDDLWYAVQAGVRRSLRVPDVYYVADEDPSVPVMGRTGVVDGGDHYWTPVGWAIPAGGVAVPVVYGGFILGHLIARPGEERAGSSTEDRRLVVALADVWAAALGAPQAEAIHGEAPGSVVG